MQTETFIFKIIPFHLLDISLLTMHLYPLNYDAINIIKVHVSLAKAYVLKKKTICIFNNKFLVLF